MTAPLSRKSRWHRDGEDGWLTRSRLRCRWMVRAVTTAMRSDALPDIPTVDDFLPGYEASFWCGIGLPRNAPVEIIDKLNTEINAGLADARMKARFANLGAMMLGGSPSEFGKFVGEEMQKWAKVVKLAGIKPS